MHEPVDRVPRHTRAVFKHENGSCETFKLTAEWAARRVRELDIGAIVACGHSGLVLAGAVSLLAGVPVFAVRKPEEKSISAGSGSVTGYAPHGPVDRWVWLDDFVSSGRTFMWSAGAVMRAGLVSTLVPVCALLYNRRGDDPTESIPGSSGLTFNGALLEWPGTHITAESFDQDPSCPWYDPPSPPIVYTEVEGKVEYPRLDELWKLRPFITVIDEASGPAWDYTATPKDSEPAKSEYFGDTKSLRRKRVRKLLDKNAHR